tara:strand:+ start:638 stop:784 length:147 start_codon:yes stop_codon:yes gene_type:complete
MEDEINFLKYFSPLIGILLCPLTILFFWSIWYGPSVESETELIEELRF